MSKDRFAFGDRVRHAKRPEWGIGSVVKAEPVPPDAQRLSVRFPNEGVKVLTTSHAELERIDDAPIAAAPEEAVSPLEELDRMRESEWLASVADRKVDEVMMSLPENVRDPFRSLPDRVKLTIDLYRFDHSGRGLVDWAVAQTGLDDPLSRFSRHELEQYFQRWVQVRDDHLARLLREASAERINVRSLFDSAPQGAKRMLGRLMANA